VPRFFRACVLLWCNKLYAHMLSLLLLFSAYIYHLHKYIMCSWLIPILKCLQFYLQIWKGVQQPRKSSIQRQSSQGRRLSRPLSVSLTSFDSGNLTNYHAKFGANCGMFMPYHAKSRICYLFLSNFGPHLLIQGKVLAS
jgi:hypothetical protein